MAELDLLQAEQEAPVSDELVWDNARWVEGGGFITITIPTYRDDAAPLVAALGKCDLADQVEVVVYDDGSDNAAHLQRLKDAIAIAPFPARFVAAQKNAGRAIARNRLIEHARADWILFLDADMLPDDSAFLARYLKIANVSKPGLVVGGFSLEQASDDPQFDLHRWQALASECVPAETRASEPGRFVFTSNVMAHRQILKDVPFDETFSGWGWEDVDWGLRTARVAPVRHIDNTATHLGLDTTETLMSKYGRSGPNFIRALEKHPEALAHTPLAKASRRLARLSPGLRQRMLKLSASAVRSSLPVEWRGRALKLWRALVYAEAMTS